MMITETVNIDGKQIEVNRYDATLTKMITGAWKIEVEGKSLQKIVNGIKQIKTVFLLPK